MNHLAFVLSAGLLASCSDNLGCPAIGPPPGIVATVLDGDTGERLCDATVTAERAGEVVDARRFGADDCDYWLYVDDGTYEVEVRADGYAEPQPQTATVVSSGECPEPETARLDFELTHESQ